MVNDILGVRMMYPTMSGKDGKSWFMKKVGWEDDPRVRMDENVSGNLTDGFKLDDNSKVRISISAEPKDTDIGCDGDFATAAKRGYMFKSTDWISVEQTAFFKVIDTPSPSDNELILKGPTGEHHSNTDCCTGNSYNSRIGHENPVNSEFAYEMWHVNYTSRALKNITGENYSIVGHGWFGVKFINMLVVKNGEKVRKLEHWYNGNGDGQTWKLANTVTDTGGWGDKGGKCGGSDGQVATFGNARQMWRWDHDDSNMRFKWFSVREIDPNGTFEVVQPDVPDSNSGSVTNFIANLKLMWHINYDDGPGCGLGGLSRIFAPVAIGQGTPITRTMYNAAGNDYRTRIGNLVNNTGSALYGKTPQKMYVHMRKIGSPTGNVECWIMTGNSLTFQGVNVTASSLNSTYTGVMTEFDFTGNTHAMAVGDRIIVRYLGSDPDNCVEVQCSEPGDGSINTCYAYYNSNDGTWGKIENRDIYCEVWA